MSAKRRCCQFVSARSESLPKTTALDRIGDPPSASKRCLMGMRGTLPKRHGTSAPARCQARGATRGAAADGAPQKYAWSAHGKGWGTERGWGEAPPQYLLLPARVTRRRRATTATNVVVVIVYRYRDTPSSDMQVENYRKRIEIIAIPATQLQSAEGIAKPEQPDDQVLKALDVDVAELAAQRAPSLR